jgi:hypothetical protein
VICCFVALIIVQALADQLKFVAVFFRHGARGPEVENEVFGNKVRWPLGFGQLTPSGERQLYLLGRGLRQRYVEELRFLPANYNESLIRVRSTDYPRTIESAESLTLGLYPFNLPQLTQQQLSDSSTWMPPFRLSLSDEIYASLKNSSLPFDYPLLAVRSHNRTYDHLLNFASCPKYISYRRAFYNTPAYYKLEEQYKPFLTFVCNYLQLNCTTVKYAKYFAFVDTLISAEFDGQLPQMTALPEVMKTAEQCYRDLMVGEISYDPEMYKIAMFNYSVLLPEFIQNAIEYPLESPKLALFSTHDSTLYANLRTFDALKNDTLVPYASHIVFELWQRNDGTHFVNATFNGHPLLAPLSPDDLQHLLSRYGTIKDWDETCQIPPLTAGNSEAGQLTWLLGVAVGLILLLSLILTVALVKNRKDHSGITAYHTAVHSV